MNPNNQGGNNRRGGGGGQQGGNISVQDFTFVGPRSNGTISFRVSRGNRGVANVSGYFYVGLNALRFKTLITNGGAGPDANDPWTITTDNNGVAYQTGINLSVFGYKEYNKLTLMVDGVNPSTTELDSETTTPSAPIKAKSKRILVTPGDEVVTSSGAVFTLEVQTKNSAGQAEPNKQLHVSLDESATVINTESGGVLANNNTFCTAQTNGQGMLQIQVTVHAVDATVTILDQTTGEKVTKKLQYTV